MNLKTKIKVFFLFLLVINSTSVALATTEVLMTCKVKTNSAYSIEDGIGKQYSGIKDSFKQGDDIYFRISSFNNLLITLSNTVTATAKDSKTFLFSYLSPEMMKHLKVDEGRLGVTYREKDLTVISSSFINIQSFNYHVILKRYYRGDWNGIYTYTVPIDLTVNVATLDCKQNQDKVDDFLKELIAKAKDIKPNKR
jgi:hypothetical protein